MKDDGKRHIARRCTADIRALRKFRKTTQNTQGGYGLGLFVVNEFSRALGGHVNIKQSTEKGSHFVLTLPHKPNTHAKVSPKPVNKTNILSYGFEGFGD